MQTKKHSLIEALVNIAVGYGVAVGSQVLIFPFFGIYTSIPTNLAIGLFFTVISLIRSYLLRRLFNQWTIQLYKRRLTSDTNENRNDTSSRYKGFR